MILRGQRRYGGYIVHLGIVLMFLGFAGQAYQKEEEKHLRPGTGHPFGRYQLRFDSFATRRTARRRWSPASSPS